MKTLDKVGSTKTQNTRCSPVYRKENLGMVKGIFQGQHGPIGTPPGAQVNIQILEHDKSGTSSIITIIHHLNMDSRPA